METINENVAILRAAFNAWSAAHQLRSRRLRNKRFAYGDQWIDPTTDGDGNVMSEWDYYCADGKAPITNNVLRQIIKTIVGQFRARYIDEKKVDDDLKTASDANSLDELDSRAMEEFLISGSCIQRVDWQEGIGKKEPVVTNVNLQRFFINTTTDPMARDCEIIGQIHDLSVAELIRRTAQGSRRKAAWIRHLYSNDADARTAEFQSTIGADSQSGTDFWHCSTNKCRAIEMWTLESHEVLVCHNRATAQLFTAPLSQARKLKANPDVDVRWDIVTNWHCRWFSPMGDVLASYDSPFAHGSHPFVVKLYPLTDGEVHSFIEDVIDQQKYVNRLITLVDRIMTNSAKGVLLYPDNALPDGLTWAEVQKIWQKSNGILPYTPVLGNEKPEQIATDNTKIGVYDMINLQMKLLDDISGVSGALQGKDVDTSGSSSLYKAQSDNAVLALTDVFDTFENFRHKRDRKLLNL